MLIAGLTGGIATGKTTVSKMLEKAGAKIIDADLIARQVVQKKTPAFDEIRACFGDHVIGKDGEINREVLGDIIFNDKEKKAKLNAIVHPHVISRSARQIEAFGKTTPDAVVIMDVPLLIEAGMNKGLDVVIVVYVPESVQLARLIQRDRISEKDAMARIRSQMPIEQKKARATHIIDNSGSVAQTRRRTMALYDTLKSRLH